MFLEIDIGKVVHPAAAISGGGLSPVQRRLPKFNAQVQCDYVRRRVRNRVQRLRRNRGLKGPIGRVGTDGQIEPIWRGFGENFGRGRHGRIGRNVSRQIKRIPAAVAVAIESAARDVELFLPFLLKLLHRRGEELVAFASVPLARIRRIHRAADSTLAAILSHSDLELVLSLG